MSLFMFTYNLYQSLNKKEIFYIVDYGKLTNSKKEELLIKTYNNIFYGLAIFKVF